MEHDAVTLRPVDVSDSDHFVEWYSDEKIQKFCSWEPFETEAAAVDYFLQREVNRDWSRVICLSGKPVGLVSVTPAIGNDKCRAEIGYYVSSKYWGLGIATRAVYLAANAVFVEWEHLERLQAVVDVENAPSQRVLEKVGFQREGLMRKYFLRRGQPRDSFMFSLLSTDPAINYFIGS